MNKKTEEFGFHLLRLDLKIEVESYDNQTGHFTFIVKPNPDRYEWVERDGDKWLEDKYSNIAISEKAFYNGLLQMKGLPIYYQPPIIKDIKEYFLERKQYIIERLKGKEEEPTFKDLSEEFLRSEQRETLGFVILSLDMVGSTEMSLDLKLEQYTKQISCMLFELSNIIPLFRGYVLKYTGDGLIAYFPEPSFISKHDLAIHCAFVLRDFVYCILNPIFKQEGFIPIDIRIGLDSGESRIITVGSPEVKQHKDLIGSVINITTKIQGEANPGDIYVGESVALNLHVNWRKMFIEKGSLEYKTKTGMNGSAYKIYGYEIGGED